MRHGKAEAKREDSVNQDTVESRGGGGGCRRRFKGIKKHNYLVN